MLRFLTAPPLRPIAWYPTISAQPQVSFTDLLSWQIPVASVPTPMSLWHSSARTCSNCVYTILSQNLLSCATHERKKSERAEFIFGTRLFPSAFPWLRASPRNSQQQKFICGKCIRSCARMYKGYSWKQDCLWKYTAFHSSAKLMQLLGQGRQTRRWRRSENGAEWQEVFFQCLRTSVVLPDTEYNPALPAIPKVCSSST